MRAFKWGALTVACALGFAMPTSADAATVIGETFVPTGPGGGCSGTFTRLQGVSPNNQYAAPFDGVIVSWSYQAAAEPPQLRFKVARPEGGTTYTVIGQSGLQIPLANQLNIYGGLRIPVLAGDVIGVYLETTGLCGVGDQSGYTEHPGSGDAQAWVHGRVQSRRTEYQQTRRLGASRTRLRRRWPR